MADDPIEAAIRNGAIAALRKRAAAAICAKNRSPPLFPILANKIAEALEQIAAELETEARHANR